VWPPPPTVPQACGRKLIILPPPVSPNEIRQEGEKNRCRAFHLFVAAAAAWRFKPVKQSVAIPVLFRFSRWRLRLLANTNH
jgi:hypothetical protein